MTVAIWRLMKYAPKDGTEIVYQTDDGRVSTCRWSIAATDCDWYDVHGDQIAHPARWIPMPLSSAENKMDALQG